jgi:hypothetical protein
MKMTNKQLMEIIAENCDGRVYEGYSGRGMFGETCWGITCCNPIECIEAACDEGVRGACQDNMGRDYIVYWPSLK